MANVAQLYAQKLQKLQEQKELSVQMNTMLNSHLIVGSTQARKNLVYAIAQSKSPGSVNYYQPSEEVKNIESQKSLNCLAKRVAKCHNEIVAIDDEINLAVASQKRPAGGAGLAEEQPPGSLAQWQQKFATEMDASLFKKFEIKTIPNSQGMISTFKPNPKIYGGTQHHKSFKTLSTQLVKGRCTR